MNLVHLAPSLVITMSYPVVMVVYVLPAFEMLFSLVPVVKLAGVFLLILKDSFQALLPLHLHACSFLNTLDTVCLSSL